jgi:hypothetical protein
MLFFSNEFSNLLAVSAPMAMAGILQFRHHILKNQYAEHHQNLKLKNG